MAGGGLTGALPDLAHAVASDALPAPVAVLVFPLTFVALDVAGAASSPFGVWGSPAQPQHASKPLLQVAALGGGGVVTGLLGLSAAALGLALTNAPGAGPTLVVAVALVIAVHLWGAVRLARARAGMSVRVAGLVEASGDAPTGDPLALLMQDERLDDAAWHRVRSASTAVLADLIARTQDALAGGAQLVVWAEGAGLVPAGHEDEVVAHVADLARRYDGHVALALAVAHRDGPRHVDNRVVLVAPGGHATLDTRKARPVPGAEADHTIPGDGALAWVDTALVRLGVGVLRPRPAAAESSGRGQPRRHPARPRVGLAGDQPPAHRDGGPARHRQRVHGGAPCSLGPLGRDRPVRTIRGHRRPRRTRGATLWAEVPARRVETPYARLARWASAADGRREKGSASTGSVSVPVARPALADPVTD